MENFLAALFGGFVAGVFVLLGVRSEHKNNLKLSSLDRQSKISAVLRAIRCELDVLRQIYDSNVGGLLANVPENEHFNIRIQSSDNYFVVYQSNTDIVGQIEDDEICKGIIKTYSLAKSLEDRYRVNNTLLEKYGSDLNQYPKLVEWTLNIKKTDAELRETRAKLMANIDAYLLLHKVGTVPNKGIVTTKFASDNPLKVIPPPTLTPKGSLRQPSTISITAG
jgi:hypothetical protein